MEHNDQVHDEPFTGDAGEVEKKTSQEDNSSDTASGNTEAPRSPDQGQEVNGEHATDVSGPDETAAAQGDPSGSTADADSTEPEPAADVSEAASPVPEPEALPAQEPIAPAPEPESSTDEPDAVHEEPESSTDEPDAVHEEPESSTDEPDAVHEEPESSTDEPDAVPGEPESKPETVAKEPESKPETVAKEPEIKPEVVAEEPEIKPETVPEEPETKPEAVPEEPEIKPEASAQEPAPEALPAQELAPEPSAETIDRKSLKTDDTPDEKQSDAIETFDYSDLSREDLVNRLEVLMENQNVQEIRSDVEHIKINFYKKNKLEIEQKRKKFVEEGGAIEDFQPLADSLEEKIKVLLKKFRDLKMEYNRNLESEKQANLTRKYEVIERIKELINSKESINKTFHEFRELQKEWRAIGLVPQQSLKDLWNNYNHNVEQFYDYIKINKELRDLDLKKNLELKIQLCEKAEALLMEPSVVNAFKMLQKFHDRWREIGPVPVENRTEIWERFREATAKINHRHHEHFQDLKKQQKQNLEQKIQLCEKAEELANETPGNHRDWDIKSKELIGLQQTWKSIGFAPKKDNNKIYERFRTSCDAFFSKRREFYAQNKEVQKNNLQLKTDLCVQAESLKESTEWKKTSDDLINLQKKWKEIGPVPRKQSDAIWKRFRAACDHFFEQKSSYYKNIDKTYESNLEAKKNILEEVKNLKLPDNAEASFKLLNEYQRKWSEAGFVPMKEKAKLQEDFRQAINKHFDGLDINSDKKDLLKFRNKLNNLAQNPRSDYKLTQERERYVNRLQQLKSDIVIWENNIGFFTRSKNAESMLNDIQAKIDKAKENIIMLEEKVNMIDSISPDIEENQGSRRRSNQRR